MSKENTPKLIGQATDAQIAEWNKKSKYGIYSVLVPKKEPKHIIYFRVPDLDDLNCAYAKTDWNRQLDKWKELADVTFLGGSEEVLKNDRLFISIIDKLKDVAQAEESDLVNL